MDRPSRKTKAVNYCESKNFEDDDEDFACVKAPPSKKAKETLNHQYIKKSSSSQEVISESALSQRNRKPLDVKLFERDLEAAISLSMLNSSDETSVQSPVSKENVKYLSSVDEHQEPASLHRSNCSVDSTHLGLDLITADSTVPSKEKKEVADFQRIKHKTQDEDYQPSVASESESDKDYSELESEDEEFTVKKTSKTKKEKVTSNKGKAKQPQSTKKEKQPRRSKSTVASTPTRTPLTTKNTSEPTGSASSSKVSKPAACLSPALSRIPKWTPPGQIGKSLSSSKNLPVRSPSQGLRLGLSRLVRVKPLHPSVSSH